MKVWRSGTGNNIIECFSENNPSADTWVRIVASALLSYIGTQSTSGEMRLVFDGRSLQYYDDNGFGNYTLFQIAQTASLLSASALGAFLTVDSVAGGAGDGNLVIGYSISAALERAYIFSNAGGISNGIPDTGEADRALWHVKNVGATSIIPSLYQGVTSQVANLHENRDGANALLSGFSNIGKYFLDADKGAGKVLTSDANGVGSWAAGGGGSNILLDGSSHTDTTNSACNRGDLIVGNSSNVWDDLVIGADKKVLASDGTDATWTSIDNSHLPNRTRTKWIWQQDFAQVNGTAASINEQGTYPARVETRTLASAPAAKPTGFHYVWEVPKDYVSGTSLTFKVLWHPTAAGSNPDDSWYARIHVVRFLPGTTLYDATRTTIGTSIILDDTIPAAKQMTESTIGSTTPASLTAGEYLAVAFDRDQDNAADTTTAGVSWHGIKIEYTADM
jgi:hypothetical protein